MHRYTVLKDHDDSYVQQAGDRRGMTVSRKQQRRPVDRKALVQTWIQDELHRFEVKQEEKASCLAREINDQTSYAATYSQDFAPSVRLVIDQRNSALVSDSFRAKAKKGGERPAFSAQAAQRGVPKPGRAQSGRPSGASSHLGGMATATGGKPSDSRLSSAVQAYVPNGRPRRAAQ